MKTQSPASEDVWNEEWSYAPDGLDDDANETECEEAQAVGCEDCLGGVRFGVSSATGHPPGACFARARLIAAAPEMARLLLQMEWADPRNHWSDDIGGGNGCAMCGNYQRDGHAPDCRLVAVLRKAGLRP